MLRLTSSDYARTRWRNGRGETEVIASAPPGPEGRPDWRLSLATVEEDGPFSAFPEYDRILAVVAGAGLRLTGPGGFDETVRQGRTLRFPGALPVHCALIDGPVRNLNLMFAPPLAAASTPLQLADRPHRFARAPGQAQFLFCASGGARLDGPGGGTAGELAAGVTLCLEPSDPEGDWAVARLGAGTALVVLASVGSAPGAYV